MKYLQLKKQEIIVLKRYAEKNKLSTQEAVVKLLKEIIINHKNIQSIIQKYLSKKNKYL